MFKVLVTNIIILSICGAAAAYDSNVVGLWKFDEISGTTVTDYSGFNNHGTILGGAVLNGSGKLVFDGSNDYVNLPIGTLIQSLNDCTFAVWVNFSNSGGGWQRIMDFGSNTNYYLFLCPRTGTSGPLRFAIKAGGGEQIVDSSSTLPNGLHCVVVRINAAGHTASMFLDGTAVGTNTNVTLKPSSLGSTTNNWLGRSQYAADAYFNGSIEELRIYNYALSDTQIQFLGLSPTEYASNPIPRDGQVGVEIKKELQWTSGIYVQDTNGHDVYFGTNQNDVAAASRVSHPNVTYFNVSSSIYNPGLFSFDTAYFWRVDEVNGLDLWQGPVWKFSTASFYCLDVFDSYASDSALKTVWGPKGALETSVVYSGKSMKVAYNNTAVEASRTISDSNWAAMDVRALSVWFKGNTNVAGLYVTLNDLYTLTDVDGVNENGGTVDVKTGWHQMNFDLEQFGAPLNNIMKISLGVIPVSGTGQVYFDNICLYQQRCLRGNPANDINKDCIVNFKDFAILASYWLSTYF